MNVFILGSYMLSHQNSIQKCKETHCYVIFHSDSFWKHSDQLIGYLNKIYATEANFEFRFRTRDIHSKKWIFWLFKGVSPANVRGRISQEREWN